MSNLITCYTHGSTTMQREWREAGCVDSAFLAELRQQPTHKGLVFRGCPDDCAHTYSPLLSTSKDLEVAVDFARRKEGVPGAVCLYLGYEAYDIEKVSQMPAEKEVLCLFPQDGHQWSDFVGETYEYAGLPVYIFASTKELQREAIKLFFSSIGTPMPSLPSHLCQRPVPPRPQWKQLVKAAALAALVLL